MDPVTLALAVVPVIAATGAWVRRVEVQIAENKKDLEARKEIIALHEKRLDRFEEKLDKVLDARRP